MEILIGGADQREVLLVRDSEADATVGVLEDIAAIVRDTAAARRCGCPLPAGRAEAPLHRPHREARASRKDRRHSPARALRPSGAALQRQPPPPSACAGADAASARANVGTARRCITRVQHHQPRVIHPAVGILEPARELRPQRRAGGIARADPASASPAGSPGRQDGRRGTAPARISHHGRSPA